jgi:hypothetical protein
MDIAGLAVMRMFFGILIMFEAFRYTDLGRIVSSFALQDFYFKFRYWEWVQPISAYAMRWLFIIYGLAGLCIFLGLFYRLASLIAVFCISYVFLVEATNYLNHFYLIIVFSSMMFFLPAHKGWSLYALFNPKKALSSVPGWAIWLPRLQLAIVYSYAALAKMNVDWINGMPLYDWIGGRAPDSVGIEQYVDLPFVIYFFTYAGLLYDLVVAPLLLIKRTRAIGYCLSISFHLTNYYLFNIGVFPWFMLATTTIYFETTWPRVFLNFFFRRKFWPIYLGKPAPERLSPLQHFGLAFFVIHLTFQAVFPLRHFIYPGYVGWDEAGHNFSWHMKLRGKVGKAWFTIKDPDTGKTKAIDPEQYLTKRQIQKMATRPFYVLQFAHYLRDRYTLPGEKPAEVYAETKLKINGRRAQRLIDPDVNLSAVTPSEVPGSWVMPLRQPVWNAVNKRNRFGPAFKNDAIALRATSNLISTKQKVADADQKDSEGY